MELTASYNSAVKDYVTLLKPRVMSLVVFTGFCGIMLAPGAIHPFVALITVLSIALGSGASGAINMWYDRDIDQIMERTKSRPIPSGRVNPAEALGYGVVMAVLSVVILFVATNFVAAALLALAIVFYVFVYTIWLKRRTPQNIVIGGAAGAFPPMIGWAAVTGDVSAITLILFAIIFFWTPPHFWALALFIQNQYKNANIPMLPVTDGERVTKLNILAYAVVLAAVTMLPWFMGFASDGYLVAAVALNIGFIYLACKTYFDQTYKFAKKTFAYSIFYLFALFLALVIDRVIN